MLLYVGITNSLTVRWSQHAAEKPWWPQVAKRTVIMYGSRSAAEAAEKAAIRTEKPVHNVMGRSEPKPPKRRLPPILRKQPGIPRAEVVALLAKTPRILTLEFDQFFRSRISAYAEANGYDFGAAVMSLLYTGLLQEEMEAGLTPEERYALLEARLNFGREKVPA